MSMRHYMKKESNEPKGARYVGEEALLEVDSLPSCPLPHPHLLSCLSLGHKEQKGAVQLSPF